MEAADNEGLSKEEDDALRRLSFLSDVGGTSKWTESRIADLRSQDRRQMVRPPRDEPLPILEAGDQNDDTDEDLN